MNRNLIIFSLLIFSLIPFSSSASDFAYNRLYDKTQPTDGLNDLDDVNIANPAGQQVILYNQTSGDWYNSYLNDSAHHVNASDYWITGDRGSLRNVADILHSWLDTTSLLWSNAGHIMDTFLDMDSNSITNILSTQYDISGCSESTPGTFCYDADHDTMRFVTSSGQVLQMNQEQTIPSKNTEGAFVSDGSIVYFMDVTGENPNFMLAKADELNTSGLVGVLTTDCNNNQVCPVVFFGMVHGLDTTNFVSGDHLYISATEAGNFTTIPPKFPNVPIWVATALRIHATEGSVLVFPRLDSSNGITMNNLGLVGDFIQTDYRIKSLPGNDAINKNVFTIQMNGTTGIDIPHLVLQPGGSGQSSVWVRSGMVVPESVLCLNNTNRTEPTCFADEGNYTWEILNFNTSIADGADWGITGELEVIKDAYVHGNITIENNLNITNGSITNIWELVSTDGSRISTGTNPAYSMFSGLDSAEIFSNNQSTESGVITHALLSTDPGNEKVLSAWQSGKNNSGQYTRNSMGVFPDLGLTNVSILTNIRQMWLNFGITPQLDYFSAENKTSFAALFGLESQQLHLHDDLGNGRLLGEGDFTWINRIGLAAKFLNGLGVLISKEVVKEFGFSAGDNITSLTADFDSGVLSPFVQTTGGGIADWLVVSNVLCHSEECARALGGSGSPLRSMQTNFSSIDQDNLNLSWWLTAAQAPSDIFTVEVNNNVGSGDVTVFTSSSIFTDEFQSVILPSSMNNISIITVKFNFQGNNINNDAVYIDEVLVIGNATTTTLANVTVEDGELNFGDGTCGIELSAEDGFQDLNISCDNINFIGNVTAISVTEVSINVTDSINVQNNVTLGSGAVFWSNATCAFISSPSGTNVLEVCD